MKRIIKVLCLAFYFCGGTFAQAGDDLCLKISKSDDKEFRTKRDAKYKCKFSWNEASEKKSVEVILMKKYCTQYEGGNLVDCLIARTCSEKESKPIYGSSLYDKPLVLKHLCEGGEFELFGSTVDKWVRVVVRCHNGKPKDIYIKSPVDSEHTCPLPEMLQVNPAQIKNP